jgi:hypothetical protein
MRTQSFFRLAGTFATAVVAWFGSAGGVVSTVSADVNIGALACQPPFQEQAGIIRWHEHYLINPKGSFDAWVVCPIAFETVNLPDPFNVGAFGNIKPPKSEFHVCYLNVVDLRNQHIPLPVAIDAQNPAAGEAPFLQNPGQDMSFTRQLENPNDVGTLWAAWTLVNFSQVNAAMSTPPQIPGLATGKGPAFWTITVNCYLPDGYALNMVSIF